MARFGQWPSLVALFALAFFNTFSGIASCIFLLVLLFVLLHKVFWPVLGKLFYPLARYRVIRDSKIMASVGTACFIVAFPLMSGAMKGVLQWLAK
jgi:hypothetical protein